MGKQISTIKKAIGLVTLRYFNISPHRKRVFRTTVILLIALILFQIFKSVILPPITYIGEVTAVAIVTTFANLTFNIVRLFIVSGHRNRHGIRSDESDNFTVAMNAVVNSATVIMAVVAFFWIFNIEIRTFLSTIALFAVAIVLIFQDFIKGFLFGVGMMFSNDYEIGDYIQVGDMPRGVIVTLTFSNIQIKTENGSLLFVPNAVVRNHQVNNFSKLKPRHITSSFSLLREQFDSVKAVETAIVSAVSGLITDPVELATTTLAVTETSKDEITFHVEIASKRASLKLKDQVNQAVQRFAVEYGQTSHPAAN